MRSQINKWGNSDITIKVQEGKIITEPATPLQKSLKLPFNEEALLQNLNAYTAHSDELAIPSTLELGDSNKAI